MATNWRAAIVKVMLLALFQFARYFGVFSFTFRKTSASASATNQQRFDLMTRTNDVKYTVKQCVLCKWIFGIVRMMGAIFYIYGTLMMWYTNDPFYNLITFLQTNLLAAGSVVMSICLLRSGKKFVGIINNFFGLFRRVQCLTPHRQVMGMHQLMFLLIIVICVGNYAFSFLLILKYTNWQEVAVVTTKLYLETGLVVSLYIASIGYMCIGALYNYMNRYMREDLLPRARCLDHVLRRNKTYRPPRYTRKLIRLTRELNNCVRIYSDIYNLATTFHQSIRYQILFALLFDFSLLTTVIYSILYMYTVITAVQWDAMFFCLLIIMEVLIMILSAYSAVQDGIAANKLSLDTVYMGGDMEWNRSVEIFINRMNLCEFKPNVLGFFDISSDILVMFLSASVTYLTYILQNTKLSQKL